MFIPTVGYKRPSFYHSLCLDLCTASSIAKQITQLYTYDLYVCVLFAVLGPSIHIEKYLLSVFPIGQYALGSFPRPLTSQNVLAQSLSVIFDELVSYFYESKT